MATVTKLKAAVNNQNLPILGSNGNLYNYYCGRYINKLDDLGVALTSSEAEAINAFINNGIENGWIEYIKYFLPFIGDNINPLSGIVPIIDKINNYEILPSSIDSNLFAYDVSGRIVSFGHPSAPNRAVYLPIKSSDMNNGASIFFNKTYKAEEDVQQPGTNSLIIHSVLPEPNSSKTRFGFGMAKIDVDNYLRIDNTYRSTVEGDVVHQYMAGTDLSAGQQLGFYYARYLDGNDNFKKKYYIITKGSASPSFKDMNGSSSPDVCYNNDNFTLGFTTLSNKYSINCLGVIDISATVGIMYSFNQAVFALTTALGR